MAYKLDKIAFLYEHRTWRVFLSLVIYKDGRIKWMSHNTIYGDLEAEDRKSSISQKSMQRIMQIIGDTQRIQNFENMEEPEENWGGESKFTLYIDNGKYQILKKGIDWQYCWKGRKLADKYPVVADFALLLKQLGFVLRHYGVDAESFRMAKRILVEPEEDEIELFKTFNVFDFQKAEEQRWRDDGHGGECRLEHYRFNQYSDGSLEFEFQEGWSACSHYDGGTMHDEIPAKWLELTWEKFVDKFAKKYPAKDYFISKEELMRNKRLKRFLGFCS